MEKYPINVYIEDLRTNTGEFIEHRLHIIEDIPIVERPLEEVITGSEQEEASEAPQNKKKKNSKKRGKGKKEAEEEEEVALATDFATVFRECAFSVGKTLNISGEFEDMVSKGRTANHNDKKRKPKFHAFDLYKLVSSLEKLNNLLRITTRRVTHTEKNLLDVTRIGVMLSFVSSLALTDPAVCKEQRIYDYYCHNLPMGTKTRLHGAMGLYKVAPYYWYVPFFMEQYFPHVQLDNRYIRWNKHLEDIAAIVDKRNADLREFQENANRKQKSAASKPAVGSVVADAADDDVCGLPSNIFDFKKETSKDLSNSFAKMDVVDNTNPLAGDMIFDDDDDDDDVFIPKKETEEEKKEREKHMQIINRNRDQLKGDIYDKNIKVEGEPYKVGSAVSERVLADSGLWILDVTEQEFDVVSYETHKESFKAFGMRFSEDDVSEYDLEKSHILYSLKKQYLAHSLIIYEAFKDANDMETYDRYMCSLDDIMIERYAHMCMSPASDISENATKYMQYWRDHNLDDLDTEIIITDPTLSVMNNFVAWQVAGTKQYLGVAFHTLLVHIIYVSGGDMFRLEWGDDALHQSILLTGDGGGGKSVASAAAMKLIYKDVCERVTDTSRQQEGRSLNSIHNFQYGDDADLTKYVVSKDGLGALKKELMTSGSVKRKVLALDPDDSRNRQVDEFIYVWCGVTLECSNKGAMEISMAAQRSNGSTTDADALMSRYILFDVPMVTDPVNTLDAAISNIDKTPAEKYDEQQFIDKNIKIHIIRMHYWNLVYTGALKKPNMMLFDTIFPKLLPRVKSLCPGATTNRSVPKIRTWVMQRVVLRSIVELLCSPISVNKNMNPFEPRVLKQMVTTVTVDDIIAGFTGFFRTFYPSDMNVVIDILKNMMKDSVKNEDGNVVFQNPNSNEEFSKVKSQLNHLKEEIHSKSREDYNNNSGNREANMMRNAEKSGFIERGHNSKFNIDQDDDNDNERNGEGSKSPSPPNKNNPPSNGEDAAAAKKRLEQYEYLKKIEQEMEDTEKNVSYVCFKDKSLKYLAEDISVMAEGRSVRPSLPSINRCLQMITKWKINTPHYKWKKGWSEPVLEAGDNKKTSNQRGIIYHNHNTYINYKVFENDEYLDLCTSIMTEVLNFEHSVPGKYLSLIPNPEAYDLPSYVYVEIDSKKKIVIDNHKYIPDHMNLVLKGKSNRDKMPVINRPRTLMMSMDMDTVSIMTFYSKQNALGKIDTDVVKSHHPSMIKNLILQKLEEDAINGNDDEDREIQMYPEHAILDRIQLKRLKLDDTAADLSNADDCQNISNIISNSRVDMTKLDVVKTIKFYQVLGANTYNCRSLKALRDLKNHTGKIEAAPQIVNNESKKQVEETVSKSVKPAATKTIRKGPLMKYDENGVPIIYQSDGSVLQKAAPAVAKDANEYVTAVIATSSTGKKEKATLYMRESTNKRVAEYELKTDVLNKENNNALKKVPPPMKIEEFDSMMKTIFNKKRSISKIYENITKTDVLVPPEARIRKPPPPKPPAAAAAPPVTNNNNNNNNNSGKKEEVVKKRLKKKTVIEIKEDEDGIDLTDDDDDDDDKFIGVFNNMHLNK